MPRYFFNIQKDNHVPDNVGVELKDLAEARTEAVRLMGEDLKDHPNALWNDEQWHVQVSDERGLILFTVYSTAIESAAGQS